MQNKFSYQHILDKRTFSVLLFFLFYVLLSLSAFTLNVLVFKIFSMPESGFAFIEPFKNFYFAFSLPLPVPVMFILYAVVVSILLNFVITNWKSFNFLAKFSWILIFSGATVNILERIILGYVRDYFHILYGYFNLADVYISFGLVFILLASARQMNGLKEN